MKISQLNKHLETANGLSFLLPNNEMVESHFHITECGLSTKHFLDCGGVERIETAVVFQLWSSNLDLMHRLTPQKLQAIISSSKRLWGENDPDVEFEYQGSTIYKYGLEINGSQLHLTNTKTACLAEDLCGVMPKLKVNLSDLVSSSSCCTPGSGCC